MSYHRIENEDDIIDINRHRSVILPVLQEAEKTFFSLVASGNVDAVATFLDENEDFNVNCNNFQGVTALHIAIQNCNEKMIRFLLSIPDIDVKDCALCAIKENQYKILQILLNRLREVSFEQEICGCTNYQSIEFPDCVSPLILASQLGCYEIIGTLIERGHKIRRPHIPSCNCSDCELSKFSSEDLLHAEKRRLHLYHAVTNPAYICQTSDDPVLTAFKLSVELRKCSISIPAFRSVYIRLHKEVSQFAVDLISLCRNSEEVQLLLKQPRGMSSVHFLYPRLVLAMDMDQEAFVAHSNTQQIMETKWLGDWQSWRNYPVYRKILIILIRAFILPIIALMCIVVPQNSWVKHWSLPINKLISHIATYLLFLVIIFYQSCRDKTGQVRGPPNSGLEPIIIIYIFGFLWSTIRLAVLQGPKRYFKMLWNVYDVLMLIFFSSTFLFWFLSYMDVERYRDVRLERKYWNYLDSTLVAEGLFAIAVIMAFFRLLLLLQLDYNVGPLQISLGKMFIDIAKFGVIFAVIIIAFTAGLCRLYQYYDGMVQVDPISDIKTVQQSSFVDLPSTFTTLFWAIFCMSPIESADVIIENVDDKKGYTQINNHQFTEAVGYFSFAIFEVLCVIVILNMLIATMSNTFQRVTDNVDIEWTFGRMEVYVQYMLQTTLPSPYNLIPTANGIGSLCEWITTFLNPEYDKRARCTFTQCCFIERDEDKQVLKDYPALMSQLVQRYFRDKKSTAKPPNMEFENLKKEVNDLKAQIKEILTP